MFSDSDESLLHFDVISSTESEDETSWNHKILSFKSTLPELPSMIFSDNSKISTNNSMNDEKLTFLTESNFSYHLPRNYIHDNLFCRQSGVSSSFDFSLPNSQTFQPHSIVPPRFNNDVPHFNLCLPSDVEDPGKFLEIFVQLNSQKLDPTSSELTFCLEAERKLKDSQLPYLMNDSVTTCVQSNGIKDKTISIVPSTHISQSMFENELPADSGRISGKRSCSSILCETKASTAISYAGSKDFQWAPCSTVMQMHEISFKTRSYLGDLAYPEVLLKEATSSARLSLKSFIAPQSPIPSRRSVLLNRIEITILQFLDDLVNERVMRLTVRRRKWSNFMFDKVLTLKSQELAELSSIIDERSIAVNIFILEQIYQLLNTNTTSTKRELYYRNPEIGKSQNITNKAIQDMTCLLDAEGPWELGILASCKGLIAGSLKITLSCGTIIDCSNGKEASSVPFKTTTIKHLETTAKLVLLIEKDTVFRKLLQDDILNTSLGDIIIITGKGYPDVNTRYILKKIWDKFHLPIYALVDADPFGIEILLVYRYGSMAMSQTTNCMAVPSIHWLGVHPTEIDSMNIPHSRLTQEDRNRLKSLLTRPYISEEILHELIHMRRSNKKAEIEGICRISDTLLVDEYIPKKIKSIQQH